MEIITIIPIVTLFVWMATVSELGAYVAWAGLTFLMWFILRRVNE
jgi:hypothetical protein